MQTTQQHPTPTHPKPLFRWNGGKRQLLAEIHRLLPGSFDRLIEPFVGAGAVMLSMPGHVRLLIGDLNPDIVAVYRSARANPAGLVAAVSSLARRLDADEFREVRRSETHSEVEAAARLIYLQATNFQGMYRVNHSGKVSSSYGHLKSPRLPTRDEVEAVGRHLTGARIDHVDFEALIDEAGRRDLVYLDPPYVPASPTAKFTQYTPDGFELAEHERLAAAIRRARRRGARVMLSQSDTPTTRAVR